MEQQTAQPTEPVKVPATVAAVESRDFGAFREASLAQRSGKPLPEVERPTETATGETTEAGRALNSQQRRRQRDQQRINEQIRSGVEAATKKQADEIAALKARVEQPHAPARVEVAAPVEPVKETPPAAKTPDYKRYAAMPDAPKIAEFEGDLTEYTAAMSLFIADQRANERAEADKAKSSHDAHVKTLVARDDAYRERVAPKGDLTFLESLSAPVKALRPVESLGENEPVTALNFLASQVVESEHSKALLQHLSDNQKDMERFAKLTNPATVLVEFGKLVASLDPPKETAPRPKTVSDASRPVTTFAARNAAPSDPVMKAVKDRDFRAFRAARQARDAAKKAS